MSDKQFVADNISFNYDGLAVVKDLSIEVNKGEFLVLVGPSGCGKTTLLNLLSGFIKPVSGKIEAHGVIRTVYQQEGLFPWLTASENMRMGLEGKSETEIKSELQD